MNELDISPYAFAAIVALGLLAAISHLLKAITR